MMISASLLKNMPLLFNMPMLFLVGTVQISLRPKLIV